MAKELPYFKFEPSAWDTGKIQMCPPEVRAVFIDLCSVYWQRLGDLPYKLAVQKICAGNATALDSLYEEGVIKVKEGQICIDFLNEQLSEFENVSSQNAKNAREGWEKRRKDATALRPQSERNAIREEKIREEEKKEYLNKGANENFILIASKEVIDPLPVLEYYEAQLNGTQKEFGNIAWRPLVPEWFSQHIGEEFNDAMHAKNSFKKFYIARSTAKPNGKQNVTRLNLDGI